MMSENNKLILIVEDEADTADMFAEMIKLDGNEVIKILHSSEAIRIIEEKQPDAILLDLMMPDVSGMEVLRTIKQNPKLENIPVIVISAKAFPDDIKEGFEAGASEYLTKPVTFQMLKATLEKHIVSSNKS